MWKGHRNRESGLAKASPRSPDRWGNDFVNAIERFYRDPFVSPFAPMAGGSDWLTPRMNISESENAVTVSMEVPGVKPEDVQIEVTGDTLTVRGEKHCEKSEKDEGYQYNECEYGSFFRSIDLPTGVDTSNVNAKCRNGLLNITLKKRPEAQPKRITVQGDGQPVAAGKKGT